MELSQIWFANFRIGVCDCCYWQWDLLRQQVCGSDTESNAALKVTRVGRFWQRVAATTAGIQTTPPAHRYMLASSSKVLLHFFSVERELKFDLKYAKLAESHRWDREVTVTVLKARVARRWTTAQRQHPTCAASVGLERKRRRLYSGSGRRGDASGEKATGCKF